MTNLKSCVAKHGTPVCGRMISSGLNNDSTDFAMKFMGGDKKKNILVTTNMSKTNTADSKQCWLLPFSPVNKVLGLTSKKVTLLAW